VNSMSKFNFEQQHFSGSTHIGDRHVVRDQKDVRKIASLDRKIASLERRLAEANTMYEQIYQALEKETTQTAIHKAAKEAADAKIKHLKEVHDAEKRAANKALIDSNALPDGFAAFVDDIELEDFMYLIHRSAGKVKIYDPEQVDTAMRVPEWTPLPDTFDIPIGLPAAVIVNMQREMSRNGGRPVQIQSKRTRGDAVSAIEAAHPPPPPPPEWTGP